MQETCTRASASEEGLSHAQDYLRARPGLRKWVFKDLGTCGVGSVRMGVGREQRR